jgi:hypothetical protein
MIEDLTGNIKRICEGIAREVGARVRVATDEKCGAIAEAETRQLLFEWFLGNYIPGSGE